MANGHEISFGGNGTILGLDGDDGPADGTSPGHRRVSHAGRKVTTPDVITNNKS